MAAAVVELWAHERVTCSTSSSERDSSECWDEVRLRWEVGTKTAASSTEMLLSLKAAHHNTYESNAPRSRYKFEYLLPICLFFYTADIYRHKCNL